MNRIEETFRKASEKQLEEGLNWYKNAYEFASSLGDVKTAAGVIAALSPRVNWEINKEAAKKIMSRAKFSSVPPSIAGTYRNKEKAWEIAKGGDPETVLTSSRPNRWLKVKRFYLNLLGDTNSVTVDVWTARVVLEKVPNYIAGSLYLKIEKQYQLTAKKLGITPRELQAVCWVVKRGEV